MDARPEPPPLDSHPLEYRLLLRHLDGSDSQLGLAGRDLYDEPAAFRSAQEHADAMGLRVIVVSAERIADLDKHTMPTGTSERLDALREHGERKDRRAWLIVGERSPTD